MIDSASREQEDKKKRINIISKSQLEKSVAQYKTLRWWDGRMQEIENFSEPAVDDGRIIIWQFLSFS